MEIRSIVYAMAEKEILEVLFIFCIFCGSIFSDLYMYSSLFLWETMKGIGRFLRGREWLNKQTFS